MCTDIESPVEIVHTGECLNVGLEVSLRVFESASEGLKWMLLKSVELRNFRTCCVDVLFELDDNRHWLKGWLFEQLVTDVGQLQMNEFIVKLDICLQKD